MGKVTDHSYEYSRVAIDVVVFGIDNSLKVLLKRREKEPFYNMMELFGGLLRTNETAGDTLHRKFEDVFRLDKTYLKQFGVFTHPKRDPRFRTVTIGYIFCSSVQKLGEYHDWFEVSSLPDLAFDHKRIIIDARDYIKENFDNNTLRGFLPEHFPLNNLQQIYEIILEKKFDNRNFRKQVLKKEIIKETDIYESDVNHRPARLYDFTWVAHTSSQYSLGIHTFLKQEIYIPMFILFIF